MSVFDPDEQLKSVDNRIAAALERVSEAFQVKLRDVFKEHKLSPLQIHILIFLLYHDQEARTVTRIAHELNLTKPTVSDAVRSLEQKGLLEKEPGTVDSRQTFLNLTSTGKSMAQTVSGFANDMVSLVAALSPNQKAVMLESLLEIINKLQRMGIIPLNAMCFTCRYYAQLEGDHYCKLMKRPLLATELRLNCPEHEPAEA